MVVVMVLVVSLNRDSFWLLDTLVVSFSSKTNGCSRSIACKSSCCLWSKGLIKVTNPMRPTKVMTTSQ
eukprot:05834.XXX_107297_107500_1 [CDS] Oithona nana genome sequencing.